MEHVGEYEKRNQGFDEKFPRARRIQKAVNDHCKSINPILFDVGAHVGESVNYLKRLFPSGQIYSFEPDPASFNQLVANTSTHQNVQCFNLALAAKNGQTKFYRNRIDHTNSLLPVNLNSHDSIYLEKVRRGEEQLEEERFNQPLTVETAKLDDFCAKQRLSRIDLLKLDVQGAEVFVLEGGKTMLNNIGVVVLEVSFFDYYEKSTSFFEIESFLKPLGFRLYAITEISNNPMNGRTDWVEAVYTNTLD